MEEKIALIVCILGKLILFLRPKGGNFTQLTSTKVKLLSTDRYLSTVD